MRQGAERALVAACALLFGLGFGLNFGVSNENTYLLGGLRLLDHGVLSRDWLAAQTTPYHRLFSYPVAALLYLDSSGWLFAVVNILMLAFGAVIVFKLVQTVADARRQLLVFVLVLLLTLATRSLSVGYSTLYTSTFEPSTIGVTGFLLGMYLFVRGRYLLSGLALVIGGVFHANYLLLSFPVFLIAHLLVRRPALRPLLRQFVIPVVALIALLPVIVPIALQPGSAGTDILLSIRSPHHYQPLTFRDEFVPFLGWLLLMAASVRRDEIRGVRFCPPLALLTAMTALILLASALTSVVYISSVAQMYVWRLAPLVVLLCQIYAMRTVVAAVVPPLAVAAVDPASPPLAEAQPQWLLPPVARAVLVVVAAECFMYFYYFRHRDWVVLEVLGGILLLGLLGWGFRRWEGRRLRRVGDLERPTEQHRFTRRGTAAVAAVVFASLALALVAGLGLSDHSNLLLGDTPESQLYSWARTTAPDSVFLIPPEMDDFRLASRRAIVVDWKSPPFAPAELEEWYRRIDAVSGRSHPQTLAQATAAYGALSDRRLSNLADLYAVSYVVEKGSAEAAPPAWPVVFDNGRYRVLRTEVDAPG